ncbi:DUF992 domain-containing protein [Lutibaculum baratangense]|uniref:DUF992 domain-containing protein n=1 Tax=Lutibaculum baratangense AMV1 TaxID=631454 RepID=V4RV42_9HYPH|nr:DUF992 domain-containing protein [Lutibaculum baratangense]ESR26890.1 hypothetical protein N177_0674 [Lutibaculum baratangense AMV1]
MTRSILAAIALASGVLAAAPSQAQERVEAGVLRCDVAGGTGFIFGSTKQLNCIYESNTGLTQAYTGNIRKFGVDIGATADSVIVWGVLAPTTDVPPDTLRGTYDGISAEATAGVGIGANALIGGNSESIVLQPLSIQAQSGLNIAAGLTSIELVPAM